MIMFHQYEGTLDLGESTVAIRELLIFPNESGMDLLCSTC